MRKKSTIITAIVFALMMVLNGCSSQADSKELASVNGIVITQSDVNQYLPLYMSATNGSAELATEEEKAQALEDLLTMEVLSQYYADKKDEILPETLEEDYKEYENEIKSDEYGNKFMTDNNISYNFLKRLYINQNYMAYFFQELTDEMESEDIKERAKDIYEEEKKNYVKADAEHILLSTEEEAKDVLARLEAGEDFNELAKELSIDTSSGENGGGLGAFGRGRMVEEFDETVFTMKPGTISDIVKTQFGYHIIKLNDRWQPTFEEVYVEGENLYLEMLDQVYNEKLEKIKENMTINYVE